MLSIVWDKTRKFCNEKPTLLISSGLLQISDCDTEKARSSLLVSKKKQRSVSS